MATNRSKVYSVYPIVFGLNAAGVDETHQVLTNSRAGLWSYQFPDNHVIGSNSPPQDMELPGAKVVGVPGVKDE